MPRAGCFGAHFLDRLTAELDLELVGRGALRARDDLLDFPFSSLSVMTSN